MPGKSYSRQFKLDCARKVRPPSAKRRARPGGEPRREPLLAGQARLERSRIPARSSSTFAEQVRITPHPVELGSVSG